MRRVAWLAVGFIALGLALGGSPVAGEQWGGVEPGVSTMPMVRGLRGSPTRTVRQKVDGYDTAEWIYEDAKAPPGIRRMTVAFGLKTADGYRPELVRSFKLEPKAGAFDKDWITAGWGAPSGVGQDGDNEFFFYKEGLFVYFDQDGHGVRSMLFTPPQLPPADASPQP